MLAVDDQERRARHRKVAHLRVLPELAERELFRREQQHRSRNDRLVGLVAEEVADLAHLAPVQLALKGAGPALDRPHEALHVVDFLGVLGRGISADDFAAVAIKTSLESDVLEQVLGRITHEIELGVLLAHPQCEHRRSPPLALMTRTIDDAGTAGRGQSFVAVPILPLSTLTPGWSRAISEVPPGARGAAGGKPSAHTSRRTSPRGRSHSRP